MREAANYHCLLKKKLGGCVKDNVCLLLLGENDRICLIFATWFDSTTWDLTSTALGIFLPKWGTADSTPPNGELKRGSNKNDCMGI